MMLGGILGFAMSLFLLPAHVAAEFITQEAGLSFASMVTATGDGSSNTLTVFFELAGVAAVFRARSASRVFAGVARDVPAHADRRGVSFAELGSRSPPSGRPRKGACCWPLPWRCVCFLTTLVLVLMTRAAPQLNLYSVGFPLRVLVSLPGRHAGAVAATANGAWSACFRTSLTCCNCEVERWRTNSTTKQRPSRLPNESANGPRRKASSRTAPI